MCTRRGVVRRPEQPEPERVSDTLPYGVHQKCAELAIEPYHADSAGINILEPRGEDGIFRWHAATGALATNLTVPYRAT